jgi:hypothetical protein
MRTKSKYSLPGHLNDAYQWVDQEAEWEDLFMDATGAYANEAAEKSVDGIEEKDFVELRNCLIGFAEDELGASSVNGRSLWGHVEPQCPGSLWVVDDDDMTDFGYRLLSGQKDAYSLWRAEVGAREVKAASVAQRLRPLEGVAGVVPGLGSFRVTPPRLPAAERLARLQEKAGATGDWDTVLACSLLEREILALIEGS